MLAQQGCHVMRFEILKQLGMERQASRLLYPAGLFCSDPPSCLLADLLQPVLEDSKVLLRHQPSQQWYRPTDGVQVAPDCICSVHNCVVLMIDFIHLASSVHSACMGR